MTQCVGRIGNITFPYTWRLNSVWQATHEARPTDCSVKRRRPSHFRLGSNWQFPDLDRSAGFKDRIALHQSRGMIQIVGQNANEPCKVSGDV